MLRRFLDKQGELFKKGGRLERFYPLYEAMDTFLYTPGAVAGNASFARDGADLKRIMITVVAALVPAIIFSWYNVGLQANLAIAKGLSIPDDWHTTIVNFLGTGFDPNDIVSCAVHGFIYYLPILAATFIAGGLWEVLFAIVRKHEINEGFFVTGMLFPMLLPPTIPLWQVALAISFGIVIGKEVFGGVGYNILNPALTARAFLFFAYPGQISGNSVWVAVDGYSSATPLALAQEGGFNAILSGGNSWMDCFLGFMPGSMGETSTLAILIGAAFLIFTGVASWRIMASIALGTLCMSLIFNASASDSASAFALPFKWHIVLGGWAFGAVFMATDPVTAPYSNKGKYIYGLLIGALVIIVRVLNPAYPEGMMLSILLMNVFAPLIDYYVVKAHKKKRMARYEI
jgi:Na+-transporting NADH:ubiquinone oxidoreductase subunit B